MKTVFSVWPLDERSNLNWRLGEPGPHSHPFHQVFFITKGSGTHWVDGVETRIHGPWVMLVAKGKTHLYLPDAQDEGWMFDFGEDFLDADASWVFSDFLASPNLHQKAHRTADFKLFQAFLQELDKSFQNEKEVEFYARKLRCTARRLGSVCKAVLGKTPQTLIIERVMLEAKRLLLHSDMSVQQVASLLGCEEPSNFTKAFRKATGETPSGFRRARQLAPAP